MVADGDRGAVQGPRERLDRRLGNRHLRAEALAEDFFGDFYQSTTFGMLPTARISVIKRRDERNYKLKAQSPVVTLGSVLGTRQTFTLNNPLKIRKGEFLGLTIPTWAPSFAVGLSGSNNVWRSSREAGKCSGTGNIKAGKAQQKVARSAPTAATTPRLAPVLGYYTPR